MSVSFRRIIIISLTASTSKPRAAQACIFVLSLVPAGIYCILWQQLKPVHCSKYPLPVCAFRDVTPAPIGSPAGPSVRYSAVGTNVSCSAGNADSPRQQAGVQCSKVSTARKMSLWHGRLVLWGCRMLGSVMSAPGGLLHWRHDCFHSPHT